MSSMNEPSARHFNWRQPAGQATVQLPGSDDAATNANSKANVFVLSNDHDFSSKSMELVPKDLVIVLMPQMLQLEQMRTKLPVIKNKAI